MGEDFVTREGLAQLSWVSPPGWNIGANHRKAGYEDEQAEYQAGYKAQETSARVHLLLLTNRRVCNSGMSIASRLVDSIGKMD
jgi:hypothetical protein